MARVQNEESNQEIQCGKTDSNNKNTAQSYAGPITSSKPKLKSFHTILEKMSPERDSPQQVNYCFTN